MARELELHGHTYRIDRLNAFQQLHISRKIAPLIPPLVPAFAALATSGAGTSMDTLAAVLEPLALELAGMADKDAEYVMATALSVVRRRQSETLWAPVWSQAGSVLMFDDIDLGVAMQLTYQVILHNLGPFIQGLLSKSPGSPSGAIG